MSWRNEKLVKTILCLNKRTKILEDFELFIWNLDVRYLASFKECCDFVNEYFYWVVGHFVYLAFSQVPNALWNVVVWIFRGCTECSQVV